MFYRFLNKIIASKILKLHPVAIKYLSNDLEKSDNKTVSERLRVFRNYTLLHKHLETDQRRLYIINKNYMNFLKAILFLYQTSSISVSGGVFTAPTKIYNTINATKESFEEMVKLLSLVETVE